MKKVSSILSLMLILSLGIGLYSCGPDLPEEPQYPENPNYPWEPNVPSSGGNSGNNSGNNNGNNNSNSNNNSSGGEIQNDVLEILLRHNTWYKSSNTNDVAFTFRDNLIQFLDARFSGTKYFELWARGTFTLNGYTIYAKYDEITIDPDNQTGFDKFPDWTHKGTKSVTYTIKSISDNCLVITDGKTTWTLDKTLQ